MKRRLTDAERGRRKPRYVWARERETDERVCLGMTRRYSDGTFFLIPDYQQRESPFFYDLEVTMEAPNDDRT